MESLNVTECDGHILSKRNRNGRRFTKHVAGDIYKEIGGAAFLWNQG